MRFRTRLPFLVLAALLASTQGCDEPDVMSISPAALSAKKYLVILDVRSAEEFASGHIPGALHIPYQELKARSAEVPQDREVAVYCMVGPRARLGEQALTEAGHKKLLHVEGGLSAWQAAGLPVETGPRQQAAQ